MNLAVPLPYTWLLALSAVLFAIGVAGVLLRRNGIAIFLSLELMLNAGNLAFVAYAMKLAATDAAVAISGQLFVFFVIGVAAAEAAVGLALLILLHRLKESIDVDRANILRW